MRERLRFSEEAIHLFLAGIVGVIGGLTNFLFYLSLESIQMFALHHKGDIVEVAEILEPWQRVVAPALGGLAAGLVLYWGLRLVRGRRSGNLMEVVVAGDGRLSTRSSLIKGVSSLISIGTGASIGREGAITQLTSTFASAMGQAAGWQPYRLRLLVACGAAAGMSAAYNAPIAGAVFAAMIVLGNFSMTLFAPLVFASVVATIVSRNFFGIQPWYEVPSYNFTNLVQLPWFILLGIFAGVLGAVFLRMIYHSQEWFKKLRVPVYVRLALGGLVVGGIAVWYPYVWGNGYAATNLLLNESLGLQLLVGLFLAKLIATLASVGSGTVGGIFTPTLFMGAALGSLFGVVLHRFGFAEGLPTAVFGLVGMGSVLAATLHSPLLAMIMTFEISLNYSLMPALMLGCVVSSLVARALHPDSIYTEALRGKGVDPEHHRTDEGAATQKTVGDLMKDRVEPIRENATLPEIAQSFLTSTFNFLPVVNEDEKLLGVVALQDLKEHLNLENELAYQAIIAMDVMRPRPPCLTPNQKLADALPILLKSEQRNVPVVNNRKDFLLIGAVARAEALGTVSEAIAASGVSRT